MRAAAPRPMPPPRPILWIGLVVFGACGEAGSVREARFALERGDLAQAQAHLGQDPSRAADTLRREIEATTERRAQVELRLAEILAEADEQGAQWARESLRLLLEREAGRDPRIVERIERVQSELADHLAAARSRTLRDAAPAAALAPRTATAAPIEQPIPPAVQLEIEWHAGRRDWVRAFSAVDLALDGATLEAPALGRERARLLALALGDADRLLDELRTVESESGLAAAWAHAAAERERFPHDGSFGALQRDLVDLERRLRLEKEARAAAAQAELELHALPERAKAPAPRAEPRSAAEAEELRRERELMVGKLARASRAQREAALAVLTATGEAELVARALEERWSATLAALEKSPAFRQLERLAEQRVELDRRRKDALALIFDEEAYFYPYTAPACPPEKAARYAGVQRRVDELVGAVREVWEGTQPASVPKSMREDFEELAWNRSQQTRRGLSFAYSSSSAAWLAALPPEAESVSLAEFAWDASERTSLELARKVRARNEELWRTYKGEGRSDPSVPSSAEQEQVRATNDYRAMFGRRALAWNARIQAAAQGHSDFLSRAGALTHYQPEPERRTPSDRMRLAGYTYGVGENCHQGYADPAAAHESWTRSSGHHRTLLMESIREMASALTASYWTQNFGTGTAFLAELAR